jgi:ABC-type branched-subunit amino acid transport system substrate-binding protein
VGKDVYWKFLAESQPEALGGRRVRVVFRDDGFNPNRAVQVCREMVEQEKAFVLVGGGGADQITACAKYADEAGVPYFSAGVNEGDLTDLSTYFALSLTYAQQVPLLLRLIDELEVKKVGVVINDTPSFADAHDVFVEAAKDADLDVVVDDSINKVSNEAEALAVIGELKQAGAEVVFLLVSPLVYLSVASAARNQSYDPVFIGPGITSGLNTVTSFGCPAVGNGQFFSPFPELDVINELDPDYFPAYQQFAPSQEPDDIGIALWGLNKNLALMFEATGDDLGRAALMDTIESGDTFETNVYPPVSYGPESHFGGTGAHLLEADCAERKYITKQQFVELGEGS